MSKDKATAGWAGSFHPSPTRSEAIKIHIELDRDKYQKVADLVEQLTGWVPPVKTGDTLNFDYTFAIDYFGRVEKNLEKVLTILGQAETAVVSVDSELIDGVTCLIARVVEKLRQIQTMVAPREA
jgi:hypothetical protein